MEWASSAVRRNNADEDTATTRWRGSASRLVGRVALQSQKRDHLRPREGALVVLPATNIRVAEHVDLFNMTEYTVSNHHVDSRAALILFYLSHSFYSAFIV